MSALGRIVFGAACAAVVALEGLALAGWQGWRPARVVAAGPAAVQQEQHKRLAPIALAIAPASTIESAEFSQPQLSQAQPVPPQAAEDPYYAQLRSRIQWVPARIGMETLATPDIRSRMLLVKSAAQRAGLNEVGLSFKDVYGIINAETSWIPRTGASRDGTPNLGIAQFEPATARLLGMRDPNDPVESVHVAALHMKDAALWAQERITGLDLDAQQRAAKLREGVSIYYNLSSRGRAAWNGRNTGKLPRETQLHIHNARIGAREADLLDAGLRQAHRGAARAVLTASNLTEAAASR